MLQTIEWILFAGYTIIAWFILAPYCIYYTHKFYTKKNLIIIDKRYPTLVIILCICVIFTFIIEAPLVLLPYLLVDDPANYIRTHQNHDKTPATNFNLFIIGISIVSNHITISSIPWIVSLRYWLIYFNIEFLKSTENKTWKIHINHLDIDKDWFLRNKSTYGRQRYCLLRLTIFVIFLIITSLIFRLSPVNASHIVTTLGGIFFTLMPMLIIFILAYKIRKWNDKFYIVRELKIVALMYVIMTIVYAIFGAVIPSLFHFSSFNRALSVIILQSIGMLMSVYIQTMYTLKSVSIKMLSMTKRTLSIGSTVTSDSNVVTTPSAGDDKSINIPNLKRKNTTSYRQLLAGVFSDFNKFELFMQHMQLEWSMELLLAVVELSQFQYIIKDEYDMNMDSEQMNLITPQIALLNNKLIPLSFIVYHKNVKEIIDLYTMDLNEAVVEHDKMIEFKIRAYALFLKYIDGNELEINISFKQKQKLYELFKNKPNDFVQKINIKPLELFELFNDVILEIFKLLRDSYHRFSDDCL